MSLWQFHACRDGWLIANGADRQSAPPTREAFESGLKALGW